MVQPDKPLIKGELLRGLRIADFSHLSLLISSFYIRVENVRIPGPVWSQNVMYGFLPTFLLGFFSSANNDLLPYYVFSQFLFPFVN